MIRSLLCLSLVVPLAGCAASAHSVPVEGKDTDLTMLAGNWTGQYTGKDRSGTISFALEVGRHTAEGFVVMGGELPSGAEADTATVTGAGPELKIQFVKIGSDQVAGKIAPYTDPTCSCQVVSEFTGTVHGDMIDGQFVTKRVDNGDATQEGSWAVSKTTAAN